MLWVITLPSSYGSPGHLSIAIASGKRGWTFFPWDREPVATDLATKFPLGERLRSGEVSTLSWGAIASPLQRFTWCWQRGSLSHGYSLAGGHSLHGHGARVQIYTPTPSALYGLQYDRSGRGPFGREGRRGEERESWGTPSPLLRLSWVIFPSPNHCIRQGKIIAIQLEIFGSTT